MKRHRIQEEHVESNKRRRVKTFTQTHARTRAHTHTHTHKHTHTYTHAHTCTHKLAHTRTHHIQTNNLTHYRSEQAPRTCEDVCNLLARGAWQPALELLQKAKHEQGISSTASSTQPSCAWIGSREALSALIIARTHVLAALKAWTAVLNIQSWQQASSPSGFSAAQGNQSELLALSVQRAYRKVGGFASRILIQNAAPKCWCEVQHRTLSPTVPWV